MAEAQPELPQELIDRIQAKATVHYNDMKASATAEQITAYWAMVERIGSDEEFKATFLATLSSQWSEADANNDGKLNLEEFRTFADVRVAYEKSEYNIYVKETWPDNWEEFYGCIDAISEGDGVVVGDFFRMLKPWMAKYRELKAAE